MPATLILLERSAELAAIDELLARASQGSGGLVVIEGPAGIGKTRLVEAAVEAAGRREMATLTATASELEADFAFGLARELFEPALAELPPRRRAAALSGVAALATSVLGLEPPGGRRAPETAFAAVHALYWLTANLAAAQPLLLAVDDAHWADTGSLRFLHFLARRISELPVALVVATRPFVELAESAPILGALLGLTEAPLSPAPLGETAVAELIRERFGEEPEHDFVTACIGATNGNAFLVTELLRALTLEGVAPDSASTALVTEVAPDALRRRVGAQIAAMPADAGALARAVAVLEECELPRAAIQAGLDLPAAQEAARALKNASLLAGGRPLRYAHPILASAIAAGIPPGELAAAHARAASLLAEDRDSVDAIAAHLLRSEPAADAWTVATLREAAAAATNRGAPEAAITYLRRAIAEPPPLDDRAELLLELGRAESRVLDFANAVPTLRQGLAIAPDGETKAALAIALSLAFHQTGDFTSGIGILYRTRASIPDATPEARMRLDRALERTVAARSRLERDDAGRVRGLAGGRSGRDAARSGPARVRRGLVDRRRTSRIGVAAAGQARARASRPGAVRERGRHEQLGIQLGGGGARLGGRAGRGRRPAGPRADREPPPGRRDGDGALPVVQGPRRLPARPPARRRGVLPAGGGARDRLRVHVVVPVRPLRRPGREGRARRSRPADADGARRRRAAASLDRRSDARADRRRGGPSRERPRRPADSRRAARVGGGAPSELRPLAGARRAGRVGARPGRPRPAASRTRSSRSRAGARRRARSDGRCDRRRCSPTRRPRGHCSRNRARFSLARPRRSITLMRSPT